MKLTQVQIINILTLSKCEKPDKRIREYLENILHDETAKKQRIDFLNKTYKAFFSSYFSKFSGNKKNDAVMEAYSEALSALNNNYPLEEAIKRGFKAGSNYVAQGAQELHIGSNI